MNIFEVIERERWKTGTKDYLLSVNDHNKSLDRITESARELEAQMPRTVKPIIILQITVNNVTMVGDDHLHTWYKCPLCNRAICETDIFCNCGAKLDWSKEKK